MENIIIDKENTLLALNLWIWLFNNPGKEKEDFPYWNDIKKFLNKCPLCEFIFLIGDCKNCPGFWHEKYFFRQRYTSYEDATGCGRLGELCFAGAYFKWRGSKEKRYSGFIASNIRRYAVKHKHILKIKIKGKYVYQ